MKKLATKLTPAIKAWIREEFGSDYYECEGEIYLFHFPNTYNYKGYKTASHTSNSLVEDYIEVSEQEFLAEFKRETVTKNNLKKFEDALENIKKSSISKNPLLLKLQIDSIQSQIDIFKEELGMSEKPIVQKFYYGEWFDLKDQENYRIKPTPDYTKEIEALQNKAKENGMKVTINFDKI